MPNSADHFLLICSTCNGTLGVENARGELASKLPSGFVIHTVDCMAGCDRPTTVGFQAVGKAQYLFGDIQTEQDLEALAEFALQYQNSADGWTNATDRPWALFTKTISRMPRIERGKFT